LVSLPAVALALLAGACSTTGRDFARPSPNALVLGVTTPADMLATYGEPAERSSEPGDVVMIDAFESLRPRPPGLRKAMVKGEIARLRYEFTHAAMVSLGDGATARIRLLDVSFWNGKLIAYNFSSSFSQDTTDFDDKKVAALARGRTTASDVLNEFGTPGGQGIYPSVARQGTRQYTWQYAATGPRRGQVTLKRLELLFGPTDRLDQVYLVTEIKDGAQ
jgi:hypothetical protein